MKFPHRRQGAPDAGFRFYLAARKQLGMPSYAASVLAACPWCRASVGEPCRVRAIGTIMTRPHPSRAEAAEKAAA